MRCLIALVLCAPCAAVYGTEQCLDGDCSPDDVVPAVSLLQHEHSLQIQAASAAGGSTRDAAASNRTHVDNARASCAEYTSTVSTDGLAKCTTDTMPYSYGYHFHVTYDESSDTDAMALMNNFMQEFGVDTCDYVEETGTLYGIDEPMCIIVSAKKVKAKDYGSVCEACLFPVKFMSIYLRAELMFDNVTYATSPWQWMAVNTKGTTLDVFVHPLQRCPNAGHALWGAFVNGEHSTAAAAVIGNAIDAYESKGNNGCYGLQQNGCDRHKADDNTHLDEDGQCALSGIAGYPATMTPMMALSYRNYLGLLNGGSYSTTTMEVSGASSYTAEWPTTMWPSGCQGSCDVGQVEA